MSNINKQIEVHNDVVDLINNANLDCVEQLSVMTSILSRIITYTGAESEADVRIITDGMSNLIVKNIMVNNKSKMH